MSGKLAGVDGTDLARVRIFEFENLEGAARPLAMVREDEEMDVATSLIVFSPSCFRSAGDNKSHPSTAVNTISPVGPRFRRMYVTNSAVESAMSLATAILGTAGSASRWEESGMLRSMDASGDAAICESSTGYSVRSKSNKFDGRVEPRSPGDRVD